jgi:hypothetical protein
MSKLFASSKWILIRIVAHWLCLIPLIFIWHISINKDLYTGIFVAFLVVGYLALIWAQSKIPLISISDGFIRYSNFFYVGTQEISIKKIQRVIVDGHRITFKTDRNAISINLSGNNIKEVDDIFDKIQKSINPLATKD